MEINRIAGEAFGLSRETQNASKIENGNQSFSEVLSNYMNNVNHQILESEQLNAQLATGQVEHLHDVTIAAEKALISLQLTTQVRDKAVEAYQEVMRMQL